MRGPNRYVILAAMLAVNSWVGAPATAQQGEANALDARMDELYRGGKFSEAIPLAERVLAIREKALGPDHLEVARSLNNLAALYDTQGRYADAEPLYRRLLTIQSKALGPNPIALAPILAELRSMQRKPDDLREKGENVSCVRKEIDHALERIAAIESISGSSRRWRRSVSGASIVGDAL